MSSPVRRDARRYRRRILAIGAALFGVLYIVMAPAFVDGVESDLEERVPEELAEAGFPGIVAAFSGQAGTLTCSQPLNDPEAAREAAYDVWGVHSIELDRTCRVNVDGEQALAVTATSDGASGDFQTSESPTTEDSPVAVSSTMPADPSFDSLASAITGSPQLSLLAVLLDEAGLMAELADPGADPVTWFAPTDDAFEMLPADFLAALRSDPDTLRTVLVHHETEGRLGLADLTTGPLQMSDGSALDVDAEGRTIDGVTIHDDSDVDASNGMMHVIDGVLLPEDLDPAATLPAASVDATFTETGAALTGVVADEAARDVLAAAAGDAASDQMVVDPGSGIDAATAEALAPLVVAARDHLVAGSAGFDGDALFISGSYADDADRDALLAAAEAAGVEATLTPVGDSTVTTSTTVAPDDETVAAEAFEDELNALVRSDPILFETNRSTIATGSDATLEQIAEMIQASEDVTVVVEGHTDSDGNANDNLWLSRFRARAVRDALVARGVPDGTVTWEGFGSQHPILADGVEDKAASRRVEFRVETSA